MRMERLRAGMAGQLAPPRDDVEGRAAPPQGHLGGVGSVAGGDVEGRHRQGQRGRVYGRRKSVVWMK
jgi:hypothetical protein